MRRLMYVLLGVALTGPVWAQGDPVAGERKAGVCAGCHSIPGYRNAYPAYSVPRLGGQHASYIAAALKAYQTRQRSHSTMQAIAASLSDQDMADLGAYFAAVQQ